MNGISPYLLGCSALAFCLIGRPAAAQQYSPLTSLPAAVDSEMVSLAALVLEKQGEIDALWPGFWSEPEFILHRSARVALLHTHRTPFQDYVPLHDSGLPQPLQRNTYISTRAPIYAGERDPKNPPPYALDLDARPLPDGVHLLSIADVLIHESFHRWQTGTFRGQRTCIPQWYPRDLPLPEGFRAAVVEELSILAAAVREEDESKVRAGIREYLMHRMQRLFTAQPLVTHIEERQELTEGSARFVGNAAHLIVYERSSARLSEVLASALEALRGRALDPTVNPTEEQAGRMYGTGAAMAYLLEHLHTSDWRIAAQSGQPLDEQLARQIGLQQYLTWRRALPAPEQSCLALPTGLAPSPVP